MLCVCPAAHPPKITLSDPPLSTPLAALDPPPCRPPRPQGEDFTCLDPVSDSLLANASSLTSSLTALEDVPFGTTCGVWGEGFFARVSWTKDSAVSGRSVANVPVLGGVFLEPEPDATSSLSIYESQVRRSPCLCYRCVIVDFKRLMLIRRRFFGAC